MQWCPVLCSCTDKADGCHYHQHAEDNLLLHLRNTSLLKVVFDSLDLMGRVIRPALLNARSLAAELAGTVKSLRASSPRARKRLSLKIMSPPVMSLSGVKNAMRIVCQHQQL